MTIDETGAWFQARFSEIQRITGAFSGLVNGELQQAWGPPGQPGDETEILRVCNLLVECVQSIIQWEENVRFAELPAEFDEMQSLLPAGAKALMEQIGRIPKELAAIFEQEKPTGVHTISLTVALPDGWDNQFKKATELAFERVAERRAL